MRIIGKLENENLANRFSRYLQAQQLENSCESSFDVQTGHMSYQIWIHDEDRLNEATLLLQEFQKNPFDPKFISVSVEPPTIAKEEDQPPVAPHRFKNHLTVFFLFLCSFLFFLNFMQEKDLPETKEFVMTPLQKDLMYDVPPSLEGPYWKGGYDWVVNKIKGTNPSEGEGPLFTQIRQGEIWRLFTPALLHKDILHILFNMLWLWYLGRPIEQRIGPFRTLLLTLATGIFANTMQYLMSGALFLGYSGIVTGLAGFIWMREKVAPWEGYPLNRSTILFLLFFIVAIFIIQVVAFGIQIFTAYNFTPNIANSAHIAGAILGAFLARLHFFAQRVHK